MGRTLETLSWVLVFVKILSVTPNSALSAGTKLQKLVTWELFEESFTVPPDLREVDDESNLKLLDRRLVTRLDKSTHLFHVDAFTRIVGSGQK